MLISLKELTGYEVNTRDGNVGTANDFLFDQKSWSVRYIIDKSEKRFGKEVLIAVDYVRKLDMDLKAIQLDVDSEMIRLSPQITVRDLLNPERNLPDYDSTVTFHAGWITDWNSLRMTVLARKRTYANVTNLNSGDMLHHDKKNKNTLLMHHETEEYPSLQSADKTFGFKISSRNGDHGYMQDLIVNEDDWSIKFLVINMKKNLSGKSILISPESIDWVSWRKKHVSVDMEKEKLAGCPNFNMSLPLNNELQAVLQDKYECSHYWG